MPPRAGEDPPHRHTHRHTHLCDTWIGGYLICARSTELSDNTIKTLPILCQSVRQLQLQERINLYIMTSSSSLPLHIFSLSRLSVLTSRSSFQALCERREGSSLSACREDENKSVVNRSCVDRRALLKSCLRSGWREQNTKDGVADKQVDSASVWFQLAPYAACVGFSLKGHFFQVRIFIVSYTNSR